MGKSTLKELLSRYKLRYPSENKNVKETIEFLYSTSNCFDRNNLNGHFTGSAWVLDESRKWVLMTNHYQLNAWLQLGGHADGRSDLQAVALCEAQEESGLSKFNVLSDEIFDLDIHCIPKYKEVPSHIHYDIRFIFETKRNDDRLVVSKESRDVSWIPLDEVLNKNSEHSIERMLKKTKSYIST